MLNLTVKLSVWSLVALALYAQTGEPTARTEELAIRVNPRYSAAFLAHKSPADLLSELELKLEESRSSEGAEYRRFLNLPHAAKGALEAAQDEKAKSYAEEALEYLNSHPKLSWLNGDARSSTATWFWGD